MSYTETKQKIRELSKNAIETDKNNEVWGYAIFIIIPLWWFGLSYSLVSGFVIQFFVITFIFSFIFTYLNEQSDTKKDFYKSNMKSLNEKAEHQKEILKKWDWKFQHDIEKYETKVHVENLIEEFDSLSDQRKEMKIFLSEISEQYPKDIKKLEKEIEHFGDTITKKDEEYINRIKKIKSLRKEIKQTELNLIHLDEDISSNEKEIFSYIE